MDPDRELELVRRAARGDGAAFEALVSPHLTLLLSAIRRILRDSDDVQDVLQEGLLTIHRELHRFEGRSRFSTWAYRICLNETLMQRRRRARQREEALEEAGMLMGDPEDGQDTGALDPADTDRFWRKLGEGLVRLSAEQRAVFILRDVQGVDTEEAARRLGITRGLVRQRLHRARAGLRGSLARDPLSYAMGA